MIFNQKTDDRILAVILILSLPITFPLALVFEYGFKVKECYSDLKLNLRILIYPEKFR